MKTTVTFNQVGTFAAFCAAEQWCRDNKISYGSMERGNPIGLMRGDWAISKWTNMTKAEQRACDGIMTAKNGFREGPVVIEIETEGGAA